MAFLEFHNLSKSFAGVHALKAVSFGIEKGTIHGLVGENGAGKSTLVKILSAVYPPDTGSVRIDGVTQCFATPFYALHAGVSFIHQELQLVPHQTVAENILLGTYASKRGIVRWHTMYDTVQHFFENVGVDIDPRMKVSHLTIGQQQMVEILKSIYRNARILALDEPTSSLSKVESDILFAILKTLRREGVIVIYISHRMAEIFELCDACTVLKDGKHIATYSAKNSRMNREALIQDMTGQKLGNIYNYRARNKSTSVLNAKNICGHGLKYPVTVRVCKKEIVGLFGLIGAGRSELVRLIYAAEPMKTGTLILEGKKVRHSSPRTSIKAGVMFLSEDRKTDGIIQGRSVLENITVSSRRNFLRAGFFVNWKKERSVAQHYVHSLSIKTPHLFQDIVNLSGGNQQKVMVARWLSEEGLKVLIVDEPTRGIDVGAKKEIYSILYSLADKGIGILVVSSELPEIMGICDRAYIMREGRISYEVDRENFDEEVMLEYAFPQEENCEAG